MAKDRQEAQAQKATVRNGYHKHYIVRPYPLTLNRQFPREENNFPFCGFPEPHYEKEKGIWVLTLDIFNNCQLQKKEAFTPIGRDQSTQYWTHLTKSNIFGILFDKDYRKLRLYFHYVPYYVQQQL